MVATEVENDLVPAVVNWLQKSKEKFLKKLVRWSRGGSRK